ncbi:MAG: LamG-like jellyroll fold domain-containing protein, partial [Verrucomicrobiales bacterium]
MKNLSPLLAGFRHSLLSSAVLLAFFGTQALAQSTDPDFQLLYSFGSGASLEGVSFKDDARVTDDGHVSLTEDEKYKAGTVEIDALPDNQGIKSIDFNFKLRIDSGATYPADGAGFYFGPANPNFEQPDNGTSTGLSVTFDHHDNGGADTAPAVELEWEGKVLAGATFAGRTRSSVWGQDAVTDGRGNELNLETNGEFASVSISIAENGDTKVVWNGTEIISHNVPFETARKWRVALGARTGNGSEKHYVDDISISGQTEVAVSVNTQFGSSFVKPEAGEHTYAAGEGVTFSAPTFVYLDRYGNEIETTPENIRDKAYYRARYRGVSIDGGGLDHVQDTSFTVKIDSDMVLEWQWEVEPLGAIETGTDTIDGLSPGDVVDPNATGTLGTNFYGRDSEVGETFSSVVYSNVGGPDNTLPIQFAAKSFVLENAPGAPEQSLVLSEGIDHIVASDIGSGFITGKEAGAGSFTVEFWARRDPSFESTEDQTVVCIGSEIGDEKQIRLGFRRSDESDNAFFLANDAAGSDAPGAFTDESWHHWAAVYYGTTDPNNPSPPSGTVVLYRDGEPIFQEDRDFTFSGDSSMAIGTTLDGSKPTRNFSGGVNNVRVWDTARTADDLIESMGTSEYGSGVSGLAVELTFDSGSLGSLGQGVKRSYYTGNVKITSADQIDTEWTLQSNDIVSGFDVPSQTPDSFWGTIFETKLRIDQDSPYWFELNSDDGSKLFINGDLLVDNDGVHGGALRVTAIELEAGVHDLKVLYFQDEGGQSFTTRYRKGSSGSYTEIPADILYTDGGSNANSLPFLTSTGGNAIEFYLTNQDAPFPADSVLEDQLAVMFPGFEFREIDNAGVNAIHLTDSDGKELNYHLNDWARVSWQWEKRFRFDVHVGAPNSLVTGIAQYLPYITGDVEADSASAVVAPQNSNTTATVLQQWVPEGAIVTVGTRYRGPHGCYELTDIQGQRNGFGVVSMDTVVDGTYDGSVSREYTFSDGISAPGSLTFYFSPTTHMAEIAIGEGLDVSSTVAVDAQLVPALCGVDPVLAITEEGPSVDSAPAASTTGVPTGGSGNPYVWDYVGQKFYPLMPGLYTLTWPDANLPGVTYSISINAQFPTDTVSVEDRENADGSRQGNAPDYAVDVTYPSVSDEFPASPIGHYNYVVSDGADTVPVALDPLDNDRWFFQRLAFSETADAQVHQGTNIFGSTAAKRSVLLYSYRPEPDGVATGDSTQEAFAVRVVNGTRAADVTVADDGPSLPALRHFRADPAIGIYGHTTGGGDNFSLASNLPYGWQFSAKLDAADIDPTSPRIMLEVCINDVGDSPPCVDLYQFGLRPYDDPNNPRGLFFERKDADTLQVLQTYDLDDVDVGSDWHNWFLLFDGGVLSIYRDGVLAGRTDWDVPYDGSGGEHRYGYSPGESGGWMYGLIDNPRIWKVALTAHQIRASIQKRELTENPPTWAVTFDGNIADDATGVSRTPVSTANGGIDFFDTSGSAARALDALEDQSEDGFPEVATRILTKLDTAGLGTGFLLNAVSNYNASIYNRNESPGEWGPIYPVNWSGLYQTPQVNELHVAYYQNPAKGIAEELNDLHPNVDWPYVVSDYDSVDFPSKGIHKDKRIFIASRLGTEGVDAGGEDAQTVYDPAKFANLTIYNQPDPAGAGYNPNEEHAFIARSIKELLTGDSGFNLGQDAAFALQTDLNQVDRNSVTSDGYTSDAWVLVEFDDLETSLPEMAAYKVERDRTNGTGNTFPIDILDPVTHEPDPAAYAALVDPNYTFDYPIFAGELLTAPYPLNLVVGNLTMTLNSGGNIQVNGINQRTLWNDKDLTPWSVSGGGGRFFYRNTYPLAESFWFDFDQDGASDVPAGTPLSWLPTVSTPSQASDFVMTAPDTPEPVSTLYTSYWRDDYPRLKRGESLTYEGGENKEENPLDTGLPAVVGWASAELIFDSRTPAMVLTTDPDDNAASQVGGATARVIRALDRRETDFDQSNFNAIDLTPANTSRVTVIGDRWYFKELTGSLQKRFYYDSLFGKLVFRGRLNDLEGGDPNLTNTPVSLSILEPNVMRAEDYQNILNLASNDSNWTGAIDAIYRETQNPQMLDDVPISSSSDLVAQYWSGFENSADEAESSIAQFDFFMDDGMGNITMVASAADGKVVPLNSLGTGSALVPNPSLLTEDSSAPLYVTLVENNHPEVSSAVALHVIEIPPARFRGAIKVVEAQDVFDEKINLRHTGDFGGNTNDIYYEWFVRDTDALSVIGRPDNTPLGDPGGWQTYAKGRGLHSIDFKGSPEVTLADKFFYVRYGHADEDPDTNGWRLIDLNNPSDTWAKAMGEPVPYQWAGASDSPQLQADGSKDFIPQLVMGWVKRVLDRVNPYEARFSDFADNESPSVVSNMISIAGTPYIGDVALNSDKDSLENVGLIELYETILNRAKSLTLDADVVTDGTNQALLLAATRLAILYEILGREAYTDANIPTVVVSTDSELAASAPFVFPFQNQVATAGHEELALLRGTDFVKAYPSYNRLFWNYVKGLGEAAYNSNYAIWDINVDGFINEFDAAEIYPHGHGDAWGHFLSASKMHYTLLTAPGFDWQARSEFYSLLDNVLPADFIDEKAFARIAVARARTGKEIVRATYRQDYSADPSGQWQGYTDADPDRAWG